jgi:hypothetical protein
MPEPCGAVQTVALMWVMRASKAKRYFSLPWVMPTTSSRLQMMGWASPIGPTAPGRPENTSTWWTRGAMVSVGVCGATWT